MTYNPYDFYFKKAKKEWYKARSAFKLEEIQNKFHIIDKNTKIVVDIGCAPGSRMQYTISLLQKMHVKDYQVFGFDLKKVEIQLPGMHTYVQDITEQDKVNAIFDRVAEKLFGYAQKVCEKKASQHPLFVKATPLPLLAAETDEINTKIHGFLYSSYVSAQIIDSVIVFQNAFFRPYFLIAKSAFCYQ